MRVGNYNFAPALIPTMVTLIALAGLVSLGFWQLDRAEQKQDLFADFDSGDTSEQTYTEAVQSDAVRYQAVFLSGRYESERQVLLDNMISKGRPGFHVLTPMIISGTTDRVLVNRGWVERPADWKSLPDVTVSEDTRLVHGRIADLPRAGIQLENAPAAITDPWPRVLNYPTLAEVIDALGITVLERIVLLNAEEPDGYFREWRPQVPGPDRHYGYAFQWFALAAALLVIYFVVNLRKEV